MGCLATQLGLARLRRKALAENMGAVCCGKRQTHLPRSLTAKRRRRRCGCGCKKIQRLGAHPTWIYWGADPL